MNAEIRAILKTLLEANSKERAAILKRADGTGSNDAEVVKSSSPASIAKMYEYAED